MDDFLFSSMVAYPELGERFVKILLKTIFGREFRHLSVTVQKVLYGADTDLHGRSRKEGEAIGEARGKAEGEVKGDLRRLVTLVCKKMKLGQSLEKMAEDLVEEVSVIEPIYNMAGKYEPEYDPELVMKELAEAGQRQEKE